MATDILKGKKLLILYGDMWSKIEFSIESESDKALTELAAACGQITTTNCSWDVYRVAQLLPKLIRQEQERRLYAKLNAKWRE